MATIQNYGIIEHTTLKNDDRYVTEYSHPDLSEVRIEVTTYYAKKEPYYRDLTQATEMFVEEDFSFTPYELAIFMGLCAFVMREVI